MRKTKRAFLQISEENIQDLENIANGTFYPLKGFLRKNDFLNVVEGMRLPDGSVWPIPIVLDLSKEEMERVEKAKEIILVDKNFSKVGLLKGPEFYAFDKKYLAKKVFGTIDLAHPGVDKIFKMKDLIVGGDVEFIAEKKNKKNQYNFSPSDTKAEFKKRGWRKTVAFQTRNIPHRGHEFLQKKALEKVDGLFIHPVVGEKKDGDFKDEYIFGAYSILIKQHFNPNKVLLGALPLRMRYAGPREAVFHAVIRRNFGCTHFIVGRDHAGVGDYYAPDAAQKIFENFSSEELGIEIMTFPEVVFDKRKKKHCFVDESPKKDRISFSGTKLRNYAKFKKNPPEYLIRSEVYNLLKSSCNSLVDENYKMKKNKKGFVLWFTGLSGAGKSTIADLVYEKLRSEGIKLERLDGDVVRENLTKDLSFSKEDRDENIRRIGFVANLLSRNGVGVVASFISPYKKQREELRKNVENFIEIFVDAPLDVCEKRDVKGLYKKARLGEIKNFTGISDPYETPNSPQILLKTDKLSAEDCADDVISFLEKGGII